MDRPGRHRRAARVVGGWRCGPWRSAEPLPLVLLDEPCPVRRMAMAALDARGIAWRHAFAQRQPGRAVGGQRGRQA
jgi:hypothetical protein